MECQLDRMCCSEFIFSELVARETCLWKRVMPQADRCRPQLMLDASISGCPPQLARELKEQSVQ